MDIQATKPPVSDIHLPKVGINEMKIPVKYKTRDGELIKLETRTSMYVDLNAETKGISMSRLPRTLYKYLDGNQDVSLDLMNSILEDFRTNLEAQNAYLKFRFNYPLRKKSLITDASGWMYYPIELEATLVNNVPTYTMMVSIYYSSTCPCSFSLSESLSEGKVMRDGKYIPIAALDSKDQQRYLDDDGNIAEQIGTAHAQRSRADIKVRFTREEPVWIEDLIEKVEAALKTPVQIVVLRPDEQEFARINGANRMFVEDAVRIVSEAVDKLPHVLDWNCVVLHSESLHPWEACAVNWKGILNGLR